MNFLDIVRRAAGKATSTLGTAARYQGNVLSRVPLVGNTLAAPSKDLGQERGISEYVSSGYQLPSAGTTSVAGATSTNAGYDLPYIGDTGGTTTSGGSTGGVYGGDTASAEPDYRQTVLDKIRTIQSVYDSMGGDVDRIVNDTATNYNKEYDNQGAVLNNAYGKAQDQSYAMFGARGLGDSSFLGNTLDSNTRDYNLNQESIGSNRANTMGQLGQYAATTKAQNSTGRGQYDQLLATLGQYDNTALSQLLPQLDNTISNLQVQQAGLGTNQDFISGLEKITPQQNQGATQLAANLQKLAVSSVPALAKGQIAQGLIKQAEIADPNAVQYWQSYYSQLLSGQQPQGA